MKKLLLVLTLLSIVSAANADIIIRNKNMDEGYSMHVTYRECIYKDKEDKGPLVCGTPNDTVIAKGSDYVNDTADLITIDKVTLENDKTHEVKAGSSYLEYPNDAWNTHLTDCNIYNQPDKTTFPIKSILSLDDMTSPYVICQSKSKYNFHRDKP